jgi:hypothetical protein
MLALTRGDEGKATRMFEEGLAVARRLGDRGAAFTALYNLAQVALPHGEHDRATTLFEEGVALSEQVGDQANLAYCLEGLATVSGACGQAERSARLIGAAEGCTKPLECPSTFITSPAAQYMNAPWPPYAPSLARRASKWTGLQDGR